MRRWPLFSSVTQLLIHRQKRSIAVCEHAKRSSKRNASIRRSACGAHWSGPRPSPRSRQAGCFVCFVFSDHSQSCVNHFSDDADWQKAHVPVRASQGENAALDDRRHRRAGTGGRACLLLWHRSLGRFVPCCVPLSHVCIIPTAPAVFHDAASTPLRPGVTMRI